MTDDIDIKPKISPKIYSNKVNDTRLGYKTYIKDRLFISRNKEINNYFTVAYGAIGAANLVLSNINEVEGEDNILRKKLEAEAKTIRAYFHFYLVLNYCQHPSSINPNKLGLPYRDNTLLGVDLSNRGTVQETMRRINLDLDEAQKIFEDLNLESFDEKREDRITSKVSMMAIKARVALYEGKYDIAYKASKYVLSKHKSFEDLNNDKDTKSPFYVDTVHIDTLVDFNGKENIFYIKELVVNKNILTSIADRKGILYRHHFYGTYTGLLQPSDSLYNLYNDKDLRKVKFYNNDNLYRYLGASYFPDNYDGSNRKGNDFAIYSEYLLSSPFYLQSYYQIGPTVPEMMLIQAECASRGKGKGNGGEGEAKTILETLRKNRFRTEAEANSIGGTLKEVLEERRREIPFILRFYDLKRLNALDNAGIRITKDFYSDLLDSSTPIEKDKIVIEPNSNDYAFPFNVFELLNLGWEQNPE